MNICIPSGNFGNMMGALLAKRMGVPIHRLVIATNANDEVPVYFKTHAYDKIVPSINCISNAMNVGHPSNFARVMALYGGQMDETGRIHKTPDLERLHRDLWSVSIGDKETRETIRKAWQENRLLLEPHGAVAWAGLNRYWKETGEEEILTVSVETAHPAKFPDEIRSLLGFEPEAPESISKTESKEESFIRMENDYAAFHALLKETYGS